MSRRHHFDWIFKDKSNECKNEKIVENEIFGLMMRWNRNHVFEMIFMVSEHDIIQIIRTQGDFWGQPISHNTIISIRSIFSRKFLDFIRISLDSIKKMNDHEQKRLVEIENISWISTKFYEISWIYMNFHARNSLIRLALHFFAYQVVICNKIIQTNGTSQSKSTHFSETYFWDDRRVYGVDGWR